MMYDEKIKGLQEFIINNEIATDDEMSLVCNIIGTSPETYWKIIYCRTGLRNMNQLRSENYIDCDDELNND